MSRFDGENWKNFTTEDGLAGDIVFSLARDNEGYLWVGTDRGVSRFDGERFENYSAHDGLVGREVYAIAVTPQNDVLLGSRGGVTRLVKKSAAQ